MFKVITVTGTGKFPVDMLRVDACWPARSVDSSYISKVKDSDTFEYSVNVITDNDNAPSRWKWEELGWSIDDTKYTKWRE